MPWDLAWDVRGDTRSPKPEEFAAPSWSWASVIDQVDYGWNLDNRDSRLNCVVRDFHCVPEGEDPTGALKSASLTISGLVCPCELNYDDISSKSDCEEGVYRLFTYDLDGNRTGFYHLFTCDFDGNRKKNAGLFNPDYALHGPGKGYIAPNTPLQCLWIIVVDGLWVGLVLSKSRQVADAYERIGLLQDMGVRETKCIKATLVIV